MSNLGFGGSFVSASHPLPATTPADPALSLEAVVPSDSTDLTTPARALWIGGAGNLSLIAASDSAAVTISGVAAGTLLPISAKRVRATGTTATLIVALR